MTYINFCLENDDSGSFPGLPLPPYYASGVNSFRFGAFHGPIDPSLEASDCTSSQPQERGSGPQMERYLLEQQNHLFRPTQRRHMQKTPFVTAKLDMIPPIAPRSQGRRGSPFSQHHSSAASGAQSPLTESDAYYDSTQGPTTPPDIALMSPYMSDISYEHWECNSSHLSLAGIALIPSGGCVNPSEINPSQTAMMESHDAEPTVEFSLHRGSSFDSMTSSPFQETPFDQPTFALPMSPEPSQVTIKQEIHVKPTPAPAPVYPDPDNIDKDVKSPDEIVVRPRRSRNDGAGEHKPATGTKAPRRQKSKPRRTRKKPSSTPTLTEKPRIYKHTTCPSDTSRRILSAVSNIPQTCSKCNQSFKGETALQKHTKTQHTRPFVCVFHFAGCDSTFAAKNEWKRHVQTQHLALYYWLCDYEECGQAASQGCQPSEVPAHGRPFRRKDLFTQHARRMHTPAIAYKTGKGRNSIVEWEEVLKNMQEDAYRQRCELPTYMRCPAQNCPSEFHGEKAWDDRMEHVARHLERAANDEGPKLRFGGPNDETLTNWAASDSVRVIRRNGLGWETCSPLKEANLDTVDKAKGEGGPDEDAEGEDYS